jgi:Legume lectin domain
MSSGNPSDSQGYTDEELIRMYDPFAFEHHREQEGAFSDPEDETGFTLQEGGTVNPLISISSPSTSSSYTAPVHSAYIDEESGDSFLDRARGRWSLIGGLSIAVAMISIIVVVIMASMPSHPASHQVVIQRTDTPAATVIPTLTDTPTSTATATATATSIPSTSIPPTPRPVIAYDNGFPNTSLLRLNGSVVSHGSTLRLTSDVGQGSSVYYTSPLYVRSFSTVFTYQATNALADGMTFIIQNQSPVALGGNGGGLCYSGISKSVAVIFKFFNYPQITVTNQTGLGVNGAFPSTLTDLSSPILFSGDLIKIAIQYSSNTLHVTLTDTVTQATATQSYGVDIGGVVGSNTAYVGFTAATGALQSTQDLVSWHFQS